jgi:hypothetical protein
MKKTPHQKVDQYDKRRAFARKDIAEFRVGKKEFVVCRDCKNVYYKKSWHHDFPKDVLPERKDARFMICPACKMAKDGRFEGQIIIENAPMNIKKELVGLIKNFGKEMLKRDSQDRILKINQTKDTIEVLTSENQLAKRIARRIKDTYAKRVKEKIFYSLGGDIVRIRLTFLQ